MADFLGLVMDVPSLGGRLGKPNMVTPGSILSSPSGSAIKRITAGVKACR
jgi:hypothetical protein